MIADIKHIPEEINDLGRGDEESQFASNQKDESYKNHESAKKFQTDSSSSDSSVTIPKVSEATNKQNTLVKKRKGMSLAWRLRIKWLKRFLSIKLIQVLMGIFIAVMSFTPVGTFGIHGGFVDRVSGLIIDTNSTDRTERGVILARGVERAIVGGTVFEMICLGISRVSAFTMYPALVLVFTTKLRATMNFLSTTTLSLFLIEEHHELHVYCGYVIFINSWLHVLAHLIRWGVQGNINLVFDHVTGRSGFVAIIVLNFICVPMMFAYFRRKIAYEIRKYAHYLFIVFAISLAFHVPRTDTISAGFTIYVFPILIIWWFLDWSYVQFFMTEKIETTLFHVLPSGVQLTMRVSDRFRKWGTGGYCYVCLPWVDKNQWHAFSLFESPSNEHDRQVFFQKAGDWTNKVHEVLQRDTVRPVWVQGPFQSPYSNADAYDNQILIAGGIGITPALSVIRAHKGSRRTNLIWVVRDPVMVEFFLEHAYLDHKGWNLIFYTGDKSLLSPVIEEFTSTNLCVVMGRPDLRKVITNIIYGIESGKGLPERYLPDQKEEATALLADKLKRLDAEGNLTSPQKLAEVAAYAQELGFLFTDLLKSDVVEHAGDGKNDRATSDRTSDILNALRRQGSASDHGGGAFSERVISDGTASGTYPFSTGEGEPKKPEQQHHTMIDCVRCPATMNSIVHRVHCNTDIERAVLHEFRHHRAHDRSGSFILDDEHDSGRGFKSDANREDNHTVAQRPPLPKRKTSLRRRSSIKSNRRTSRILDCLREEMIPLNQMSFEPWKDYPEAQDYCKNLDVDKVLTTWGMLYCGGSKALEGALKMVSEEFELEFHAESFSW